MIKKGIFAASWWLSSLLVSLLALLQACSGSGTPSYPLGGAVSGLSGAGLVLANGADTVQVPANASSFTFAAPLPRGSTYAVTIQAQPAGQTCLLTHGAGIVAAAPVDSVTINCSGPWIWSSGSDKSGAAGVYGTKGVATAGSVPGARGGAVSWTDAAGNLWLFGGSYVDATGKLFFLNDLWRYAPSSGLWTWMSGSSTAAAVYGSPGSYGVRGVAAPGNVPGSRAGAVSWKDAAGNFWLFGGEGYDSSSNLSYLNDLWKYDTATGEWTWVAGPDLSLPASAVYGTQGVAAPTNLPGPRAGSVSWIDASGDLWLFGGNGDISNASPYRVGLLDDLWEFSPSTGQWTWISGSATVNAAGVYGDIGIPAAANIPTARYGAGSWIDASGNLWLFGGSSFGGFLNDVWKFTPSSNQWTWVSGSSTPNVPGNYNGTQGAAANDPASSVPGARTPAAFWSDAAGNFWMFGGNGISAPQTSDLFNDLWVFSPASGQWAWISGSNSAGAAGVYGTLGTAAPANVPGARDGSAAWVDGAGNFWLFGGASLANPLAGGELNDLWEYGHSN
jgi:N-acetylneuraminic acid mutarotase